MSVCVLLTGVCQETFKIIDIVMMKIGHVQLVTNIDINLLVCLWIRITVVISTLVIGV